jgi:hypothetical protein
LRTFAFISVLPISWGRGTGEGVLCTLMEAVDCREHSIFFGMEGAAQLQRDGFVLHFFVLYHTSSLNHNSLARGVRYAIMSVCLLSTNVGIHWSR